jgi:hypothetical protein
VDDDIVDVAKKIRPFLEELVEDEAPEYDRIIAGLIADSRGGRDVTAPLTEVLTGSDATHAWVARVLENGRRLPPRVLDRGFQQLPGYGEVIDAERFECPDGDYVWYRMSVGDKVPSCPTHDRLLVLS